MFNLALMCINGILRLIILIMGFRMAHIAGTDETRSLGQRIFLLAVGLGMMYVSIMGI